MSDTTPVHKTNPITLELKDFHDQHDSIHWQANESSGSWQPGTRLQDRYAIGDEVVDVWKLDHDERQAKLWSAAERMYRSGKLRDMQYDGRTLTNLEMCVLLDWLRHSDDGMAISFINKLQQWLGE